MSLRRILDASSLDAFANFTENQRAEINVGIEGGVIPGGNGTVALFTLANLGKMMLFSIK
jgi:hypothetical protein